jgi:hypothetical protein
VATARCYVAAPNHREFRQSSAQIAELADSFPFRQIVAVGRPDRTISQQSYQSSEANRLTPSPAGIENREAFDTHTSTPRRVHLASSSPCLSPSRYAMMKYDVSLAAHDVAAERGARCSLELTIRQSRPMLTQESNSKKRQNPLTNNGLVSRLRSAPSWT